jgi:hypothetical protein
MGFDFSVEYKPGRMNVVADALSRCSADIVDDGSLAAISTPQLDIFDGLRQEIDNDTDLSSLRASILAGTKSDQWAVVDGLIMFDQRVYVSATSALLPALVAASHTSGHEGFSVLCIDCVQTLSCSTSSTAGARLCSRLSNLST